ncbi:uncharacterized protein MONBRDRAFT_28291 [Monosiga brevicollis MX1]|uniref:Uncharacterized protein n=1 Tax=Monosiga brevicollis TaxID=81824 RepID=A9V7R2_MONBE|nr:uncharacterized protein MONBRDRAFT_28291 [Monosiga brevicollis MX1]EDQ86419.1 predicted protein [Monosiga brevicollis MX1]|eukprot:XP_001748809.1 hypothetical protein [Monosiga brevicollis MX1]
MLLSESILALAPTTPPVAVVIATVIVGLLGLGLMWRISLARAQARAGPKQVDVLGVDGASRGQLPRDCDCYLTQNYFVATVNGVDIDRHFDYTGPDEFVRQQARFLRKIDGETTQALLRELREQADRRRREPDILATRHAIIQRCYQPKDPGVMTLRRQDVAPELLRLIELCDKGATRDDLVGKARLVELGPGIYGFPCLRPAFCARLLAELNHYHHQCDQAIRESVNSMSQHGAPLADLGFTAGFSDVLMRTIARPLVRVLLGEEFSHLDHHRCFTVRYRSDLDRKLTLHYDNRFAPAGQSAELQQAI